ncbi:hypothetical protein [Haloactinomyces albus]|uniref:PH domain-containing protein n=1 Tax=Haloactinomyces albus TaxID=1352928 RepID=A0AAE3Z8W7_9ACTN|nr:hypothetical protein [Haloactinomyces albus]MDR7300486.1 hypothetical protein [Haloactinomyces albus]
MQPATAFVIDRSPIQERQSRRGTITLCTTQGVNALLFATLASYTLATSDGSFSNWIAGLQFIVVVCAATAIATQLWTRSVLRTMRGLRLVMTPQGVTYTSAAGTFSAPWSAVKKVKVGGRPNGFGAFTPRLTVHVPNWGGPVGRFIMFDRLTIHLTGTGIDANQVAHAIHVLSNGTRRVTGS